MKVAMPLAKNVLAPLGLTAAMLWCSGYRCCTTSFNKA